MKKSVVLIGMALILAFSWVFFADVSSTVSASTGAKITNSIANSTIVKTCGAGFLEETDDLRVLHIEGTPYDMGYQHGFLLADDILENFGPVMVVAAVWRGKTTDVSKVWDSILLPEAKIHEQFIPPEQKDELKGIADGLAASGSPLTYEDILVWNTWVDFGLGSIGVDKALEGGEPTLKLPFPAGCSSFSAWGKATTDGKLIYGRNTDGFVIHEIKKKPTLVMGKPKTGYAFIHPIFAADFGRPGTIGGFAGMNEAGIVITAQGCVSRKMSLYGTPTTMVLRYILQHAGSVDETITILSLLPRTIGLIYHVADGKSNEAAVIEVNASEIAVRRNEPNRDVLWTTNHYNCYPGWQSYQGHNMVTGQQKALNLADISTVEKWQSSIKGSGTKTLISTTPDSFYRYQRYRELLSENYGKIDVPTAIAIVSDRYDATEGRVLSMTEWGKGYPICKFGPVRIQLEDVPYYKSGKTGSITLQIGTETSFVAIPSEKVIRMAQGEIPAQAGPFVYFDMDEALGNAKPKAESAIPQSSIIIAILAVLLCGAVAAAVVFALRRER